MKKKVFFLMVIIGFFSCQPDEDANGLNLTEFQTKIPIGNTQATHVIDVRTAEEYSGGHHLLAQNVDYLSDDFVQKITQNYSKTDTLLLYCKSGNRSQKAAKLLKNTGYTNVFFLQETSEVLLGEK